MSSRMRHSLANPLPRFSISTLAAIVLLWSGLARAGAAAVTMEPDGGAYHFVSHYRISLEASRESVWDVLIDMQSWMFEFDMASVSGTPRKPGEVIRLYEGQDFLIQVTGVVPQKMLSIANLPLEFRGERGTGVGIFTLHEVARGTEVSLTMSRRYSGHGSGFEQLRGTRQTEDFQRQDQARWQDRFLGQLKSLVEANPSVAPANVSGGP